MPRKSKTSSLKALEIVPPKKGAFGIETEEFRGELRECLFKKRVF